MAGVIPVIFAASIMAFPPTVGQLINTPCGAATSSDFFAPNDWAYIVGESIFIILFTYFYTAVTFNPVDQADNLKKYGGFIPGVRPGRPDGRVPRPHPRAADVPRRAVPRRGRGAADDPHQPDERELLLRRHLAADRRRRRAGHDEAARGAADDAQLRGLPEVSAPALPRPRRRLVDAAMSELNLILLGPPGAGKGTQAERLHRRLQPALHRDRRHAARRGRATGTELGKKAKEYMDAGELVPDEVIIGVDPRARCSGDDARDGFLLDGFPRTVAAGRGARRRRSSELGRELTAVLLIDVPDEEVVRRISGRRVSVKTGRVYHVEFDPPKHEGVCDVDGSRLDPARRRQARDDRASASTVYHEQTEPLIDYYEERGPAAALRRHAHADRGPRPHPRDDRDAAPRRRAVAVIVKKSPEEIDKMAAAGDDPRPHARSSLEGKIRPGVTTARARRGRREVHPLAGRRRRRSRATAASPARSAPRRTRWSSTASPAPTSSRKRRHPLGRRRRRPRRLGRRRRAHLPRRPGLAGRRASCSTPPRRRCSPPSSSAGPATASATSRTPCRRASRPRACRSCARSSATASAATCTRTRRSPTTASPARARCSRRAWSWPSSRWSPPGRHAVRMGDDGWAIYSQDGSLAAHFEFTIAVTADGPADPHAVARERQAAALTDAASRRFATVRVRSASGLSLLACVRDVVAAAVAAARAASPDPVRKGS